MNDNIPKIVDQLALNIKTKLALTQQPISIKTLAKETGYSYAELEGYIKQVRKSHSRIPFRLVRRDDDLFIELNVSPRKIPFRKPYGAV